MKKLRSRHHAQIVSEIKGMVPLDMQQDRFNAVVSLER